MRVGDKYSADYVTMLSRMVREHFGQDLQVLTDTKYQGWWAKCELFAPWNARLRPCVFLDLDTYILGDCRDFLSPVEELWLIRDFYHPHRSNSGVMLIPEDTDAIWANHFKWTGPKNDGDFLTTQPHRVIQDHFSGVRSYKADPHPGRICCFHGKPKPHETTGWAKQTWEMYTS